MVLLTRKRPRSEIASLGFSRGLVLSEALLLLVPPVPLPPLALLLRVQLCGRPALTADLFLDAVLDEEQPAARGRWAD